MMAEVVAELMEGKRSIEFIVISPASTLSLSFRNARFLLLFIVVVNAVDGRHKKVLREVAPENEPPMLRWG